MNDKSKPELAIALRYGEGDRAPVVTAKGQFAVAEQIVKRAREVGIPIHESPELAQLLTPLALETPIPAQLYRLVAEVLAWVYMVQRKDNPTRLAPPPHG